VVPESGPARNSWRNAAGIRSPAVRSDDVALDPQAGVSAVPAGNPAPISARRAPMTTCSNSVIAIDAKTGTLADYVQLVWADTHDWDVDAGPVLATTRGGRRSSPPPPRTACSAIDRSPMKPVADTDDDA
jgi:glucose dehydrogenase